MFDPCYTLKSFLELLMQSFSESFLQYCTCLLAGFQSHNSDFGTETNLKGMTCK
jgi:hypothetical protein